MRLPLVSLPKIFSPRIDDRFIVKVHQIIDLAEIYRASTDNIVFCLEETVDVVNFSLMPEEAKFTHDVN